MRSDSRSDLRSDLRASGRPDSAADCAREAIILGAALLCTVQPQAAGTTHAAVRMELMACCRRAGLCEAIPRPPLLVRFDGFLAELAAEPARVRRIMVAVMDRVAGSAWGPDVLAAIARIGAISAPLDPLGRLWLDRIRGALALPPPLPGLPSGSPDGGGHHGGGRCVAPVGRRRTRLGGVFAKGADSG